MNSTIREVQIWIIDHWVSVLRCDSLDVLNRCYDRYTKQGVQARLA